MSGPSLLNRALRRTVDLAGRARAALRPESSALGAHVEVRFEGWPAATVPRGMTVLRAAERLDIDLDHFCGGQCSCGTCRVEVVAGAAHLAPPLPQETLVLGPLASAAGDRLGCQARILGPVEVRVPGHFVRR